MAELAGGVRFPAKLLRALQPCQNDPEMVRRAGIQYALEQCHGLMANNVAGIHFYTLNRSDATRTIFDSLGIPRQSESASFERLAGPIDWAALSPASVPFVHDSSRLHTAANICVDCAACAHLRVLSVRRVIFWQGAAVVAAIALAVTLSPLSFQLSVSLKPCKGV